LYGFAGAALSILLATWARAGDAPAPDAIDEALAAAGVARKDVGWRAEGWWDRYPMDVPHKLRHVDALMARPFAVVPYVRAMGASVRTLLSPEGLGKKGERGAGAVYRAVHDLAIHHRFGATRAYSANLDSKPVTLVQAIEAVYRAGGRSFVPSSFGEPPPFPKIEEDLRASTVDLPEPMGAVIGRLVLDLVDAQRFADLAWRNVPLEVRTRVAARLDLNVEMTDAIDYEPAFDDLARLWDEASLWYASVKVVEALDRARSALEEVRDGVGLGEDFDAFRFDHASPLGRIVILGTGDDELDVGHEGAWLVVDLGGEDRYRGRVAASRPERSIGALLDLGGDDWYQADQAAQGAGVAGIGVLVDAGGSDVYEVLGPLGQGLGQCGFGALVDLAGDDDYEVHYGGQGCGYLGVGALVDCAGKDTYTVWCDGQGFGGAGGVGVLADRSGDDRYEATVDPRATKRPSYHSEGKVSCSNAQGAGMGRRGDGSDGHSWAGGLGALLDAEGDDSYVCGNWGQGVGYWFGTGFLWDGAGNDRYQGNGWCSGSGAHFCIGAVVDESGDDVHSVTQNWGPAFGHDFTVGLLYDGAGKDVYECGEGGTANSINRSVAILLEGGGDDRYVFGHANHRRPGIARFDPKYLDRQGTSLYWSEASSIALFLDVGGEDAYTAPPGAGPPEAEAPVAPGAAPAPVSDDDRRARNWSIAVDRDGGRIDLDRPR
jgi:hypothetical protein